jgi:hypothetical protein
MIEGFLLICVVGSGLLSLGETHAESDFPWQTGGYFLVFLLLFLLSLFIFH